MNYERKLKKSRRELKQKLNGFLAEHGLKQIKLDKGLNDAAKRLEELAGLPQKRSITAKRRIARAMVILNDKYAKPLPLRYQPTIQLINSNLRPPEGALKFYASEVWKTLREQTLLKYGAVCMCCKTTKGPMHVDHIKPIRKYWHLRANPDNLQVLCAGCNYGKGSRDETDYRCLG